MNERERDLIAALAEGSLEVEAEALALLESSDEARAEYRLQLVALEALSEVGQATMTEGERAGVRRDLWTRMRAEKAKARSARIYGWSMAAAVLFVVVGLAAVLGGGLLARSGDDASMEAFAETAADLAETESTGEAGASPAASGEAAMPESVADRYFAEQADRLRQSEHRSLPADGGDEDPDCLGRAGLPDHEVVATLNEDGSAPVEGRYLATVPSGEPIGPDTPIDFVDADRCEVVYTDR